MNHNPGRGLFSEPVSPKPLREHQASAIALAREAFRAGHTRIVIGLPTGAGKTRIAAEVTSGARAKGKRIAFTVPAISLVDQTIRAFEDEGLDAIGVMQGNHARTDWRQPIQVVSVQSLAKRQRPKVDIVIVDECHLRFKAISQWMEDEPDTLFIGLSATPWARGMGDEWQKLLLPVTMQELIDAGLLSPFRVYAPSHPDMSKVRIVNGDYETEGAGEVMNGLVADVVETWKARAEGRPTLVFAVNRAHAAQLVEQFGAAGIRMGYCDAHVDLIERGYLFGQLARGDIAGIVNVGTLTTGVDADIRCVVLARPTRSEMLFVQMIGRALRTAPGKEDALILDHADNHARLGFVTDISHSHMLKGKDKTPPTAKERGEPMPKECGSCGLLKPAKVRKCPKCGFLPERKSDVEVQEGELVELKRTKRTQADKQKFWSMALHVDQARGKGGRLAKALFKAKFGTWPKGLAHMSVKPDGEFMAYEHSRRIAYAKSRGGHYGAHR